MTELNASDFAGPNAMMTAVDNSELPMGLHVGNSWFTVTRENETGFRLGVIMATDEACGKNKERAKV